MSQYAVHVLANIDGGRTQEATKEVDNLEEGIAAIREVVTSDQPWRAITLLHVEDLLPILEGSVPDAG